MNIFVLHENPRKCASMHSDKHVVKMTVETAQMLSTAHHVHDSKFRKNVYKPIRNPSQPCASWVAETSANYRWAFDLFFWLCVEYSRRYNRKHKSYEKVHYFVKNSCPEGEMTERPLCMPDKYKTDNPVESYRNYYIGEKMGFAEWNHSDTPDFVKEAGFSEK